MNKYISTLTRASVLIFLIFAISADVSAQVKKTLAVSGACGMCKHTILKTAKNVNGVLSADYDQEEFLLYLEVTEDGFNLQTLSDAINAKGYDTALGKADDEIYSTLPGCCQYRDMDTRLEQGGHEGDDHKIEHSHTENYSPFIIGHIVERLEDDSDLALIGATLQWLGAPTGATTDVNGKFEIGRIDATNLLLVSYVGYESDTIDVSHTSEVYHVMNSNLLLGEVVIKHRKTTSAFSFAKPIQTLNITTEELCKAACCSLSESFETSPSIDVSFTDAVTGTRQIQMLGLAGKYVQITRELIPDVRSVGSIGGMALTPGPWVESIQLSKGAGSVANGFESMTGQINVELRKPENKKNLFVNLYGNGGGRYESNIFSAHKLNKNISTAFLLHTATRHKKFDNNKDGFLDNSLMDNYIAINRWNYQHQNGLQAQIGVKLSKSDGFSGQMDYDPKQDPLNSKPWGIQSDLNKNEVWTKLGKVINESKNRSIGLQLALVDHQHKGFYGRTSHNVKHRSNYANLIFQSDLSSSAHVYKVGLSYLADDIDENVNWQDKENRIFDRVEKVPGAFLEYTFVPNEKLTVVAGIRGDQHNSYGLNVTPRLHLRYGFSDDAVIRLVAGSGWRTANIFTENPGMFVSNRNYNILGDDTETPYGLNREQAWNFGTNWTQNINFGNKKAILSLDYYYTKFGNQVIADFESDESGTVIFKNQDGKSYGHSAQAQLDLELFDKLDLRLAYRYNQSKAEFGDLLKTTPFNSFHRAFINTAYEFPRGWHADFTLNWRGVQRLPNTDWFKEPLPQESEQFFLANAQIRKLFNEEFEMYLGGENLFDFTQDNPINNAIDPSDPNFDGSLIWAPIFGINIYAGIRYTMSR